MLGFYILNVAAKRGLPRLNVQIGGLRVVPNHRFYVTSTDLQTHREEIEKYLQTGAIEVRYSDSADPVPNSVLLGLLHPNAEEPPVVDTIPETAPQTQTPQDSTDRSPPSVKDLLFMGSPAGPAEVEPEPSPVLTLPTSVTAENREPEVVETTPESAPAPEPEPEPQSDPVPSDPVFAMEDSPSAASMDDTSPVAVLPSLSIPEETVEETEPSVTIEKSKKSRSRRRSS